MQLQAVLVALSLGLAAAATPQGIVFPEDEDDGCDKGKAIPGPRGTFCIGAKGEVFGPARQVGGAAPQGLTFPADDDDGCEKGTPIPGPDGTRCIGAKGEDFGLAKQAGGATQCPVVICLRPRRCKPIKGPDGCDKCAPGCEVGGQSAAV